MKLDVMNGQTRIGWNNEHSIPGMHRVSWQRTVSFRPLIKMRQPFEVVFNYHIADKRRPDLSWSI